ncbi:MAG: hypothetical protein HY830_15200 [Actinobacteria bacterium]|nr:hypothetical protein [Actinomycetota bacterium]
MSAHRPGTLDTTAVERLLREHLDRRANAATPSLPPVADVTGRARRRERRQLLVAGLAVVTVVGCSAAVAGPWLGRAEVSLPATSTDPGPDNRWTVHDVPTRGDLAGSAQWRSAARDAVRRISKTQLDSATMDNVLFAGHLPQGVLVVVSITDSRVDPGIPADVEPTALGFWSRTGRPADLTPVVTTQMAQTGRTMGSEGTPDDVVAMTVTAADGATYFAAVPLVPARSVAVSPGPVVGRDGSVRRSWQEVPVTDGAAVATLDPHVPIHVPLVKVDGGRPWPVRRAPANSLAEIEAFVGETAQSWGIGPVPDESVVGAALYPLLQAVPVDRLTVEPVFHGRELPSTSDAVAARVRLDDGSVLNVAALIFDDIAGTGRTQAVTTSAAAFPVPAAEAATTPVAWLDDVSQDSAGVVRARARMALPGAARMEVRDTGSTPCAKSRLLGSAAVDANGLGTVVVDVPAACNTTPVTNGESPLAGTLPQIVTVALDEKGTEIGRTSVQPWSPYDLVDTADLRAATAP